VVVERLNSTPHVQTHPLSDVPITKMDKVFEDFIHSLAFKEKLKQEEENERKEKGSQNVKFYYILILTFLLLEDSEPTSSNKRQQYFAQKEKRDSFDSSGSFMFVKAMNPSKRRSGFIKSNTIKSKIKSFPTEKRATDIKLSGLKNNKKKKKITMKDRYSVKFKKFEEFIKDETILEVVKHWIIDEEEANLFIEQYFDTYNTILNYLVGFIPKEQKKKNSNKESLNRHALK
jgi:hypothetical protein